MSLLLAALQLPFCGLAQAEPTGAPPPLPDWLLELLSVDPATLEGATGHLRLARWPEGGGSLLAVLAIAAAIIAAVWIYRREGHTGRAPRIAMSVMRGLLIAGVALVLAYPVLEIDRVRSIRATTIVLLDESLSQGISDRYLSSGELKTSIARALSIEDSEVTGLTRAELVERAFAQPQWRVLERLGAVNRVKVYGFSRLPLRPHAAPDGDAGGGEAGSQAGGSVTGGSDPASAASNPRAVPPLKLSPLGEATDIAAAIRAAVEAEAGTRVAGVVLVTDGRSTAGEDLGGVAAFLRQSGVPMFTIGVGDPAPTRNIRVAAIVANEKVFAGDPIAVDVRVEHSGFAGERFTVELLDTHRPAEGAPVAPVVAASEEVELAEGESETTVSLRYEPNGLGFHRLAARIEAHPEEAFADDNERGVRIEVVEEAARVLLISGGPSYEYRFLKNLLKRDARVSLAAWLLSADADFPQEGNEHLSKLPGTARELFEYDVVLLMDIDPAAFPDGLLALLEQFVSEQHGGLAYIAGDKFSLELFGSPRGQGLRDMLPVRVDSADVREQLEQGLFFERKWTVEPTREAALHPSTRLSSRIERNAERWAELGGFYWSFPVRAAKPGATVLLQHPDPGLARDGRARPLVASQHFGGGRVLWVGIDSTWRWRALAEEIYDRFWIQSVRFLSEGRLLRGERFFVQTGRESYELGEAVRVSVHQVGEDYQPLQEDSAVVVVESPEGSQVDLRLAADPVAPGWYRGLFSPAGLGTWSISPPGAAEESSTRQVLIEPPRLELRDPRLDEDALRQLSEETSGSYARLPDLGGLPEIIPDRRRTVVMSDEPIPLWDNGLVLGILAGLLALEWILRKLNRLL